MKKIKFAVLLLAGTLISLVSAVDAEPLYFASISQETVDCVNYEGNPDARCIYTRVDNARGIGLFVVDAGEEPVLANALANTNFYVYAPKATSDSVVISLSSDGTEIGHMSKVTSNDAGLVTIVVNAVYPISNFEIGTAHSADTNATIVRVYNFYVPGVQYCLDEKCNEPVSDVTSLRPAVGEDLVIYARAYIPIGPSKGITDSTLERTFYINSLAAGENLRYYSVNGMELPSSPFGYRIDFIEGKTQFIVRADKAVASGPVFSVNGFVEFTAKGDTNFLVSEVFLGNLQFVNSDESKTDSVSTSDSSTVVADSTKEDDLGKSSDDKSSSSAKRSESSSSYADDDFASPSFSIKMTGPFEFTIVMDDELPAKARAYAVMDLQGRVLQEGMIESTETPVPVLGKGSYVVKVGIGYRRVNVR